LEAHKDFKKPDTEPGNKFRYEYIRFSHKVFATSEVLKEPSFADLEYLIWMDADVVTHKFVTEEDIVQFHGPYENSIASYLGRKEWSSETGFICFNLKNGGREFIQQWKVVIIAYFISFPFF